MSLERGAYEPRAWNQKIPIFLPNFLVKGKKIQKFDFFWVLMINFGPMTVYPMIVDW